MCDEMKILLALSGFKSSLGSLQACEAAEIGLRQQMPGAQIILFPVSDGGDGLLEAVAGRIKARRVELTASGPMELTTPVEYLLFERQKKKVAIIESAKICGVSLVAQARRNPMLATSRGVGTVIRHAMGRRAKTIYVGVGGTATQDGGAGMAQALGVGLLDGMGKQIGFGCGWLGALASIDLKKRDPRFKKVEIFVLADVVNPLLGPQGTARVYASQKGALPDQIASIEANLEHLAHIIKRDVGIDAAKMPGAGAGGGLGAGLAAFCNAKILPGAETLLDMLGAKQLIERSDIVIVGEGRLDRQTLYGKAPYALAKHARTAGKKVYGLFGQIEPGHARLAGQLGLDGHREVAAFAPNLEAAMTQASACLIRAASALATDFSSG